MIPYSKHSGGGDIILKVNSEIQMTRSFQVSVHQRTNGPVNAHLISGLRISTKHSKHGYK